jgi:UPF0148 protein
MSDENIKKMAELLRNGATMLDDYCPKCGNILFRLRNQQIFCPTCNLEIKYSQNNEQIETVDAEQTSDNSTSEIKDVFTSTKSVYSEIFDRITHELKGLKEISLIEKYLEIHALLLDNLKKIRDLEK